jgi:4-hydroxymandelate oxidase
VSNHGGRTLDTTPATATMLPRIVEAVRAVDCALPVLVDGGIRRGTDVLKAMALGASAVLVGRPAVWGLANAGAAGVAHVLRLLRDELEIAMALTGCATLTDATPALAHAGMLANTPAVTTSGDERRGVDPSQV